MKATQAPKKKQRQKNVVKIKIPKTNGGTTQIKQNNTESSLSETASEDESESTQNGSPLDENETELIKNEQIQKNSLVFERSTCINICYSNWFLQKCSKNKRQNKQQRKTEQHLNKMQFKVKITSCLNFNIKRHI